MDGLSNVTMLWSSVAAGALLLGSVHLYRWIVDRSAGADLALVVTAFGFVGIGLAELWTMHAATPEEWAMAVRWCHPPILLLTVGIVAFVHYHLGTGRAWLAWAVIGLRVVITIWNFVAWPNFNFEHVESIARISFLGDTVTVVEEAVTSRWQFLGTLESLLLVVFVLDAAIALWRKGDAEGRRRAVLFGGSMLLFTLVASTDAQLVIYDVLRLPILITPAAAFPLVAMALEQSRDLLRASRTARELADSQRRLEMAAHAVDLGLWEWDGKTNRVWATQKSYELFGVAEADVPGFQDWLDRVHADDREQLTRDMRAALETGSECYVEFRIAGDAARPRWIMARGRAELAATGKPRHVRGVMRDVSESRRAENEARELRQELAHTGRVSMLGQIASSLAHELSQPLGAILRNVEAAGLLLRAPAPDVEELKAIVVDIERDDRRARDVIDRLRGMLTRRRVADAQTMAVDALVQDVTGIMAAEAASRGVSLEYVPGASPPSITGDRVQMCQVLMNLVLNAMDAVAEQPPERRRIVIGARDGASGIVELEVSDQGPGIPPERAARIFDPFYTTKAAGMGMGLAISRTIAEAHGGTLTLRAAGEGGATFCLCLPARPVAAA